MQSARSTKRRRHRVLCCRLGLVAKLLHGWLELWCRPRDRLLVHVQQSTTTGTVRWCQLLPLLLLWLLWQLELRLLQLLCLLLLLRRRQLYLLLLLLLQSHVLQGEQALLQLLLESHHLLFVLLMHLLLLSSQSASIGLASSLYGFLMSLLLIRQELPLRFYLLSGLLFNLLRSRTELLRATLQFLLILENLRQVIVIL